MQVAERILSFHRKHAKRSKQRPRLPLELQSVSIEELPDAALRLLQDRHVNLRDTLIEQLVWAVKSIDDDTRSRAWIALVSLGTAAIMPIAEQLLQSTKTLAIGCG